MKLIVVTTPTFFVEEDKIITALFEEGLDVLHLRKPETPAMYSERLLTLIPDKYHRRIVTHEHFYLKEEFNLMGIHLNARNPKEPHDYYGHISCSCHSVEEVKNRKHFYDYVFMAVKALKKLFGGKNDIIIEVRDGQTAIVSVMGFSIKSKFGQNATLFNAGSSSQFLFKLSNCNDQTMAEFNVIKDGNGRGWSLCKDYLSSHNIGMEFDRTQYPTYGNNLFLVRESMAKILAWCVYDRLVVSSTSYGVMETVERMAEANPLGVPSPAIYYEKALKDFLMAGFTGMTAGNMWDGKEQVNGGYIVVMDDGDVICYHSSDRETFRDYLYRNTYFEYVSADKYSWSRIIKIDGEYFLPLNISVRFYKSTR